MAFSQHFYLYFRNINEFTAKITQAQMFYYYLPSKAV
uniref:Uncharacterized protein n=1 Tax=Anguilla anguilla TaxID=7936 RepID=A0A0E9PFY2_ANGAN